jgi:predicted metalloprotease with PDZ domain
MKHHRSLIIAALGAVFVATLVATPLAAHLPVPPSFWSHQLLLAQDWPSQDRGWLGLAFESVSGEEGMRIVAVHPRSPAERAGVRPGDVLLRMNGRTVDHAMLRDLRLQVGEAVRLQVRRDGRAQELDAVAGRRPEQVVTVYGRDTPPGTRAVTVVPGRRPLRVHGDSLRVRLDTLAVHADSLHRQLRVMIADSLGPQVGRLHAEVRGSVPIRALADSLARSARGMAVMIDHELGSRGIAGAEFTEMNAGLAEYFPGASQGLVVLRIAAGTPIARAGLLPGDVVTHANGVEVKTVRDLRRTVAEARDREVALDIVRKGSRQRLQLRW